MQVMQKADPLHGDSPTYQPKEDSSFIRLAAEKVAAEMATC